MVNSSPTQYGESTRKRIREGVEDNYNVNSICPNNILMQTHVLFPMVKENTDWRKMLCDVETKGEMQSVGSRKSPLEKSNQ